MILGITGGVCTGKTTAAAVIGARGVRIIDCDEISRYLANYDPAVLDAIRGSFGGKLFCRGGALDRAAMARAVFADAEQRRALEEILHPPIKAVVSDNIAAARARGESLVVVAPLLIEAGMESMVDRLWVVSSSEELQIERLCRRGGLSPAEAQLWVDAQLPVAEKEKHADTVIHNNGTLEEFEEAVLRAWRALGPV